MSWNDLRTNYTDALYEGLRKYILIENQDGSVSLQDVTEYDQYEHSFFGSTDANSMNAAINAIMHGANVASLFSESASYSIGDYAFYDGLLYKFTNSHSGPWDANDAGVVLLTTEMQNKISDAPADDKIYGRRNNYWTEVTGGGGSGDWQNVVAPEFSEETAYNAGYYVMYQDELYRFTTGHSAGAWNTNQVVKIRVMSEMRNKLAEYARLNTPTFTGIPAAPTAAAGTNTTQIATTAFVQNELATGFSDVYKVTLPSASDSKRTFTAAGITANHVLCVEGFAYLSNPVAAPTGLTLTTGANTITISGTLNGTTNIIVTLGIPRSISAS